MTRGIENN